MLPDAMDEMARRVVGKKLQNILTSDNSTLGDIQSAAVWVPLLERNEPNHSDETTIFTPDLPEWVNRQISRFALAAFYAAHDPDHEAVFRALKSLLWALFQFGRLYETNLQRVAACPPRPHNERN